MKKIYAAVMLWLMAAITNMGDWACEFWSKVSDWCADVAGKADAAVVKYEGKWNEAMETIKDKMAEKMLKTGTKVKREYEIDNILREKAKKVYDDTLAGIDATGVQRRKKLYAKNDKYAAKSCAADEKKKG